MKQAKVQSDLNNRKISVLKISDISLRREERIENGIFGRNSMITVKQTNNYFVERKCQYRKAQNLFVF